LFYCSLLKAKFKFLCIKYFSIKISTNSIWQMRRVENLRNIQPSRQSPTHTSIQGNAIFPCGKLIHKNSPPFAYNTIKDAVRSHFEIPLVQIIRCGARVKQWLHNSKCSHQSVLLSHIFTAPAHFSFFILCMLCRLRGISSRASRIYTEREPRRYTHNRIKRF